MSNSVSPRRNRGASPAEEIPAALKHFDSLPDTARVRLPVVQALTGRSATSIWRDVKAGRLPAPLRLGHTSAWSVGELRAVLAPSKEAAQ